MLSQSTRLDELIKSFNEMNLIDLPLFNRKSTLYVTRKCLARFRVSRILKVIVADWKLGV